MNLLRMLSLSHRLAALAGLFALCLLAVTGWAYKTIDEVRIGGQLYRDLTLNRELVEDVFPPPLFVVESQLVATQLMLARGSGEREFLVARLRTLRNDHETRMLYWARQELSPESAHLLHQVHVTAQAFYDQVFDQLVAALERGDAEAASLADGAIQAALTRHREAVEQLVQTSSTHGGVLDSEARDRALGAGPAMLLVAACALLLGALGAWTVGASIVGPVRLAQVVAQQAANGEAPDTINNVYPDEPGLLLEALEEMQRRVAASVAAQAASEAGLLRSQALSAHFIGSARAIVLGLDRHGQVLVFNDGAEVLTGYRRADVLGHDWHSLPFWVSRRVAPCSPGPQWQPSIFEHPIVHADGEQRLISWRNTRICDDGEGIAMLCFGVDVTPQDHGARAGDERIGHDWTRPEQENSPVCAAIA